MASVILLTYIVRFVFVFELNNSYWNVIPRKPGAIKTLPEEGCYVVPR